MDYGCADRPRRQTDEVQSTLDEVNGRLIQPDFLRQLSSSRLPSRAASDASHSPRDSNYKLQEDPFSTAAEADDSREQQLLFSGRVLLADDAADNLSTVSIIDQRFRKRFHRAWCAFTARFTMASERGYLTFDHQHADLVLAVDFNFYGTRMVTASSDHRLKVWDKKDDNWNLVDGWRAHDAEIIDVSSRSAVLFSLVETLPGS